ncbi:MAG: Uma2 family endonuclease [Gammaproteobacteria bacterium]|jgi:Uma2 family endonuclease|nr:Uma2 family endonuclease [Gammaproteobacteria bacterium]
MQWADVLADPCLRDLPYKIELDGYGRIVMTPASNHHARAQSRLVRRLDRTFTTGEVLSECSVATRDGVKVADVAWLSDDFLARHGEATPYPEAPELCVEILSPSNTAAEMAGKAALYLQAGAREVWLVDEAGHRTIHGPDGVRETSVFPEAADWPPLF